MKAVRVHEYKSDPSLDDIAEPTLQGPLDVIVKIGGAGVCRTDLHIIDGDTATRIVVVDENPAALEPASPPAPCTTAVAARRSCSTSSPSRAPRTTPGR